MWNNRLIFVRITYDLSQLCRIDQNWICKCLTRARFSTLNSLHFHFASIWCGFCVNLMNSSARQSGNKHTAHSAISSCSYVSIKCGSFNIFKHIWDWFFTLDCSRARAIDSLWLGPSENEKKSGISILVSLPSNVAISNEKPFYCAIHIYLTQQSMKCFYSAFATFKRVSQDPINLRLQFNNNNAKQVPKWWTSADIRENWFSLNTEVWHARCVKGTIVGNRSRLKPHRQKCVSDSSWRGQREIDTQRRNSNHTMLIVWTKRAYGTALYWFYAWK